MIHVIQGDEKGKTTASVGLAVRVAGHSFSVLFIQFLKHEGSGEIGILKRVPRVTVLHAPVNMASLFKRAEDNYVKPPRSMVSL